MLHVFIESFIHLYQWMLIPRSSILRNLKVALQSMYNGTYLPDVGVVIS